MQPSETLGLWNLPGRHRQQVGKWMKKMTMNGLCDMSLASGLPVIQSFSSRPHLLLLHQPLPRFSVPACHQIGSDIRATRCPCLLLTPAILMELRNGFFLLSSWSLLSLSSRGGHPATMTWRKYMTSPQ